MKQIEIMYNNCILSEYGKIICNGNEYDIDYFIKKIGNPKIFLRILTKQKVSLIVKREGLFHVI